MDSNVFLVLWALAGLAGILSMWRRGYLVEYLGCALLASALSALWPVVLGGGILLIGLWLRNEQQQTSTATQAEEQTETADRDATTKPAPKTHRPGIVAPVRNP